MGPSGARRAKTGPTDGPEAEDELIITVPTTVSLRTWRSRKQQESGAAAAAASVCVSSFLAA